MASAFMIDRLSFRSAFFLALALVASPLAASSTAIAAGIKLDSREYKLMLEPAKFDFKNPEKTVDKLWEQELIGIIANTLGKNDKVKHKGKFDKTKQRLTVFRDTPQCVLNALGYAVRERTKLQDGKPDPDDQKMTLKFRTPDIFIAQEALPDKDKGDPKFEEDIAPLLVHKVGPGGETAAFAQPPSMRSIFSVSLTKKLGPDDKFNTIADVAKHFDDLKKRLERAGAKDIDLNAKLSTGEIFHELVFEGAKADLGEKRNAEFDLSLWYRSGEFKTKAPYLAELSFKYDVDDGDDMGEVARRALSLFKGLQERLGDWTSPDRETKTAAALSKICP